jgi:hypothetical protein
MMQLKNNYKEFQHEIQIRGIEYLVHFTPTINLLSILEQGQLLCRQGLEASDIEQTDVLDYAEFPDAVRYDDKSYINLSISYPNSYLLNRFIERTADKPFVVWSVLKIKPKYIYHTDTLFSVTNAANKHNRNVYKVTGELRKFQMMFQDEITVVSSYGSRKVVRENLLAKYPTDIQAEVLVKNSIPVEDIIEICFRNKSDLAATKAAVGEFAIDCFAIDEKFFTGKRK